MWHLIDGTTAQEVLHYASIHLLDIQFLQIHRLFFLGIHIGGIDDLVHLRHITVRKCLIGIIIRISQLSKTLDTAAHTDKILHALKLLQDLHQLIQAV